MLVVIAVAVVGGVWVEADAAIAFLGVPPACLDVEDGFGEVEPLGLAALGVGELAFGGGKGS